MDAQTPRRFIIAAPPSEVAGIGDALRAAFHRPVDTGPDAEFGVLIEKLDRIWLTNRRD